MSAKSDVRKAYAGLTGATTSADTATVAIASTAIPQFARHARITNESGVGGWVSFDAGITFHRLPSTQVVNTFYDVGPIASVLIYRIAAGSNITVYAEVW